MASAGRIAEAALLPDLAERTRRLAEARAESRALLEGETDEIARMATIAAVLYEKLPYASFVGFYRVTEPELLVVGPFQGPAACLRIPFQRGVCGAAAREGRAQLVPDVHAFPGHIACDASSRSELVLPCWNESGALIGVLDLDSHAPDAFTALDQSELEGLLTDSFGRSQSAR